MSEIIDSITRFLFVEDAPEKADAIMLVGGSQPQAALLGSQLWREGYAPYLLIGGGVSIKRGSFPGPYDTEYDFYHDVLTQNGVPECAILGERRSRFTRENALFAREAADEAGLEIHSALLVCKSFHARRSLMFYQASFPETCFRVVPYAWQGITRENWHQSEVGIERVLGELRRCGEQCDSADVHTWQGKSAQN